ncbi:MAG: hypothetical protein AB7G06_00420 [Bdellovibrionales bacterium]
MSDPFILCVLSSASTIRRSKEFGDRPLCEIDALGSGLGDLRDAVSGMRRRVAVSTHFYPTKIESLLPKKSVVEWLPTTGTDADIVPHCMAQMNKRWPSLFILDTYEAAELLEHVGITGRAVSPGTVWEVVPETKSLLRIIHTPRPLMTPPRKGPLVTRRKGPR